MKKYLILVFLTINLLGSERIVTLSPSLNEIVFALGSGDDIVGNTLYSSYPEESKKILKLGGYNSISLEKLLYTKPSLVLMQDYDKKLVRNIKRLGLNYKTFKTNNIASILTTITRVGKLLNKEEKAKELTTQIVDTLNALGGIVKDKSFMIVISPRTDLNKSIYIAGQNLYFNDILNASGNRNAYSSKTSSQPVVNVEKIINLNPDVIVILAPYIQDNGLTKEDLINTWAKLPINASREKDIYVINKEYAGIPSNRVVNFMNDFKKILIDVSHK